MISGIIFIICNFVISNNPRLKGMHKGKVSLYYAMQAQQGSRGTDLLILNLGVMWVKKKGKAHPCTGTDALYRH